MKQAPPPEIFHFSDVPTALTPYIRRILVVDAQTPVDFEVPIPATGYHYLNWVWRGRWSATINGDALFDSDVDGKVFLSGQIGKSNVAVRFQHDIGHAFLEFTAPGHFQVFGLTGEEMFENVRVPENLNQQFSKLATLKNIPLSERLEILTDVLTAQPVHAVSKGILDCINRIETADGNLRLSQMLKEMGIRERHFRNQFKQLVGLTPKTFCKSLRISTAINQLLVGPDRNLAETATEFGFADQAHFTRAFGNFLGESPIKYLDNIEATMELYLGQSRGG